MSGQDYVMYVALLEIVPKITYKIRTTHINLNVVLGLLRFFSNNVKKWYIFYDHYYCQKFTEKLKNVYNFCASALHNRCTCLGIRSNATL